MTLCLSLEDEILLLRAEVDYLLDKLADAPGLTERPVNWTALTQAEAAGQWQLLCDWTDWLRDRYQLHEGIPACWSAHGAMVEELTALRTAWTGAFLTPQAAPGDAAIWHDLLDRTRHSLHIWDRNGCADGTHRPDLQLPDDTDQVLREQTIQSNLDQRHEGDLR